MEDKKFAILIDSDNISSKYISAVMDEMTRHGIATYRRIYGDWTNTHAKSWKNQLAENSITPIQQFNNTVGKNSTDSALIIDAMDILYTGNVDGFCIVSSDGDFTRLASRLRESGMMVVGMGEEKTPRSFRAACSKFTVLENLIDADEEEMQAETTEVKSGKTKKTSSKSENTRKESTVISKEVIENVILGIITENENKDKETGLGEIGSRLVNKYPDFDVRKLVTGAGAKGIGVSEISNKVHEKYTRFNMKDYGYSKFTKFLQDIEGLEVYEDGNNRKRCGVKV